MALGKKMGILVARVGAARVGASRVGFVVPRPVPRVPGGTPKHWVPHETETLPTTTYTEELKA